MTDLPQGKRAIGCKWVFKIKYNPEGKIERHKARLVAKGYTQLEGIDYMDTFSPVAKLTTVRLLLALASINNWHLQQLDVNNVFLHGDLNEEVYMLPPPGMVVSKCGQVCKLTKSLYGLKQASRQWFSNLSSYLKSINFIQSTADYSLFTKKTDNSFTILLVYVDDIILSGNSISEIQQVTLSLDKAFKIKDLGKLKYFLGLEVARSSTGIHVSQRKYALDILAETGLLAAKPCSTPITKDIKHLFKDGTPMEDINAYQRLIGKLLYLTNTRPDISYAIQFLSQFLRAPTTDHYNAAQRILRYIKSAPGKGMFFPNNSSLQLKGFSDSDWATYPQTRRSVTGFCVFVGSSLICWKSKKQSTVSRSSSEAEYRALAALTCEIQWLKYLLDDFSITTQPLAGVYCDNQSARHIASNPSFHERTKHIEIDCHIVREKLQAKLFQLLPIPSSQQPADIFTKPLEPARFDPIVSKLGLVNIYHAA